MMNIIELKEDYQLKSYMYMFDKSEKNIKKLKKEYRKLSSDYQEVYKKYRKIIDIDNKSVLNNVDFKGMEEEINKKTVESRNTINKTIRENIILAAYVSQLSYKAFKKEFLHSSYNVNKPTLSTINHLLSIENEGKTFNQRINSLILDVDERTSIVLKNGIKSGKNPKEIAKELNHQLGINYRRAETISRTECTRVFNQIEYENIMNDENVEYIIIIATLDTKTSLICREQDGNIIKKENIRVDNIPPFHPNCRSVISDYIGEELKTRYDNHNKNKIKYMKYREFEDKYIINNL